MLTHLLVVTDWICREGGATDLPLAKDIDARSAVAPTEPWSATLGPLSERPCREGGRPTCRTSPGEGPRRSRNWPIDEGQWGSSHHMVFGEMNRYHATLACRLCSPISSWLLTA